MLKKMFRMALPLAVALAFTLPSVSPQEPPKTEKSRKGKSSKSKGKEKAGKRKAEQPKAQ